MTRRHLVAELRSVGEPLTPSDLYAFVHSLPPAALAAGQDDSAVDVKLDPDTSDEDDTGLMVLLRVSWCEDLPAVVSSNADGHDR